MNRHPQVQKNSRNLLEKRLKYKKIAHLKQKSN